MILSHEDGNTSYVKNIHKPTFWARCIYTQCLVIIVTIMVFTKACVGSGFPEPPNTVCESVFPAYDRSEKEVKNQCLFLDEQLTRELCVNINNKNNNNKRTSTGLPKTYHQTHLKFCNMYTLNHILPQNKSTRWTDDDSECNETLVHLLNSDSDAEEEFQLFASLLQRVDCDSEYSVKWRCSICRVSERYLFVCLCFFLYSQKTTVVSYNPLADLFAYTCTMLSKKPADHQNR